MATEQPTNDAVDADRSCPFCGSILERTANLCPKCGKFSKPTLKTPGKISTVIGNFFDIASSEKIPIRKEFQAIGLLIASILIAIFVIYYNSTDARFVRMCAEEREMAPWHFKDPGYVCNKPELYEYIGKDGKEEMIRNWQELKGSMIEIRRNGGKFDEDGNVLVP